MIVVKIERIISILIDDEQLGLRHVQLAKMERSATVEHVVLRRGVRQVMRSGRDVGGIIGSEELLESITGDAHGDEASANRRRRQEHEWRQDEIIALHGDALRLRQVDHLLKVESERPHELRPVDAEDADLRRMQAHRLLGGEGNGARDVEGNVDALVQRARESELRAAHRDLQGLERSARIGEHVSIHEVRKITRREPNGAGVDGEDVARLVIEVDDATLDAAHLSVERGNAEEHAVADVEVDVAHCYARGSRRPDDDRDGVDKACRECRLTSPGGVCPCQANDEHSGDAHRCSEDDRSPHHHHAGVMGHIPYRAIRCIKA